MIRIHQTSTRGLPRGAAAVALALVSGAATLVALPDPIGAEEIGKVVAVRGSVTATAPGGEPRLLRCNDPILDGDTLESAANSELSLLSGEIYAGIGEKTTLGVGQTPLRTPDLSLRAGHLRIIDAAEASPARIETPEIVAENGGTDTEAFVFVEKAWVVSILCPRAQSVPVTRRIDTAESLAPPVGQCVVGKPNEPLYAAPATHSVLALLDDPSCRIPRIAALPRFDMPPPVSLGLVGDPLDPGLTRVPKIETDTPLRPCEDPGTGCLGGQLFQGTAPPPEPPPTEFPFIPPPPIPPPEPPPTEFPFIPPPALPVPQG